MRYLLLTVLCLLVCIGCLPTDDPIAPYPRTGNTTSASLGDTYAEQVFVDLATNTIVKRQAISSWHLAVSCRTSQHEMYLNDALIMGAINTGITDWAAVVKQPTSGYTLEPASGALDSLPLRDFWSDLPAPGSVYVVHLGFDDAGKDLGYRKLQAIANVPEAQFRFGTLDGKVDTVVSIPYDQRFRRYGFNALTRKIVEIEPEYAAWDLLLTRYTYFFRTETGDLPYAVVGALVNQPLVRAVKVQSSYSNVSLADTIQTPLQTVRDAIGYDWKLYDLQSGVYTVDTSATYLVSDRYGYYRALRFLDFYDENGAKGTFLFEHKLF